LGIGAMHEVRVQLQSPPADGKYKLFWAAFSPEGVKIGKRVSCVVIVGLGKQARGKKKREHEDSVVGVERVVREKREKKAKEQKEEFVWPDNITHLYLDGNNMLYVPAKLRSLMISRSKHKAEGLLEAYTLAFSKLSNIQNVTLVFDHSSVQDKEVVIEGGKLVKVMSAHRAGYTISDDALVAWIGKLKQEDPTSSPLCVTSDRGLIERLLACGGQTCKPGQWFKHARGVITSSMVEGDDVMMASPDDGFDAFFDKWAANCVH